MIPEGDKVFSWLEVGLRAGFRPGSQMQGPYYDNWQQAIGEKRYYHTLEELLKMPLAESLKKRLISAKEGTKIKLHHLHSCGDVAIRRLKADELAELRAMAIACQRLTEVNEEIRAKTPVLHEEKSAIEKQLKKNKWKL